MVNLTTLAPDIVAAILDDALPNHVTLFDLAVDLPALWEAQRARLRSTRGGAGRDLIAPSDDLVPSRWAMPRSDCLNRPRVTR
jgi:hypothetical protein